MIPSKFRIFLIFIILCLSWRLNAQYFERAYGGNPRTTGVSFAIYSDHGVFVIGNTPDSNFQTTGYYLLKIDSNGNESWSRSYSDIYNAYSTGITTFEDGRIVFLGTHSGPSYQALAEVVVLDSSGNYTGSNVYPPVDGWGTSGTAVTSTGDSSILITFYTDGFISTNYYSVYRLNADLSTDWSDFVSFDGSLTGVHGLCSSSSDDVFTLAYYDLYYYSVNLLFNVTDIRRHDSTGVLVSDSLYEFNCITSAINPTFDNGAVIGGTIDTSSQKNPVLIKIDSSGQVVFQRQYPGITGETCIDVIQTKDSGFVLLTTVDDSIIPGNHDIQILKTNPNGDSLWSRQFGGYLDEQALEIHTDGNDLVILGSTNSFGNDHIYLIRTDSSGIVQCTYSILGNNRYYCSNDTAFLYLSPQPGTDWHIEWSNGDTTNAIHVTASGNYFATLTDSAGDTIHTATVPVYFASNALADFGPDTFRLCTGSGIISDGFNEITNSFQWFLNGNLLQGEQSPFLIPQQAGMYQSIVSNYCSSDTSESFIDTLYALPVQPNISAPPVDYVCMGDSLLLSITGQPGETYQWYSTDQVNLYAIQGATDTSLYVFQGGLYLVEAESSQGCRIKSLPYSVFYDLNPEFINPNGPPSFCQGGQVELSVSSGSGYQWSTGDTTRIITVNSGGPYFVSFINQYGCPKSSDTIQITVLTNPTTYLGNDTVVCLGSSITLDAGPGFNNYYWSDGSIGQLLNIILSGTVNDTSDYFVFVTDTNGCTDGDTVSIIFDICQRAFSPDINDFQLFPNPLSQGENLSIFCSDPDFSAFNLIDCTGRILLEGHFEGRKSLFSFELPETGIYFLTFHGNGSQKFTRKLIIH